MQTISQSQSGFAAVMPCRSSEENMERVQQVFENLNQEIETLEAHARRIEALLPNLPPNARQQWEATSTARLVSEEELRKLLNAVLGKK